MMSLLLDKPVTCPVLIGRTAELEALNSLMDGVRNGQRQAVLIRGEAGIGKSRLVAAAKSSALTKGFLILQGDCFLADASYPYAPLIDILRALFTVHLDAHPAGENEPLLGELVRLLPDLGFLFSQLTPLPQEGTLEPERQKRRFFNLLTDFFIRQAAQGPVLLIVEDLHWCDESSLALLLHLVRRCKSQRLFFLFTVRSEEISPGLNHWLAQLDRGRLVLELALERLSEAELNAMLDAIFAAQRSVPAGLSGALYALTDGNPLFVEEMLKSLLAAGELQFLDGKWKLRPGSPDPGAFSFFPRSVQDAINQRVDRLSAAAKQALTLAAVAGRRFDFPMLMQAMGCDEGLLLSITKELIAAQLIIEETADRFAFRHALGQQAIYRSLLARERRSLHYTIAEALETICSSPSSREACLADLAHHFFEAGSWAKALELEQRAGEKALALYAPGAAVENLTRALDAAHHLQVSPPGKLYYTRGQAYAMLGEFDLAREDFEHACETARSASDALIEWQSMMSLGFLWTGRDYAQAGIWFRRASDQASHTTDLTLRARSLNRFGNWLLNVGRIDEALQAHQEALQIFQAQQDEQGMAETLDLLGITSGMRGDRIKAVELLGQAISLFRTLGDSQGLISSLAMRALQSMPGASETTLCPLRARDDCVQDASESLHLARQIDSPAGQAFAENALAHTLLSFGELGSALFHAREAHRIASEIKHQQWMVSSTHCFGHIYSILLAPDPAVAALEAGLSLAQELGSTFWITTLTASLGRAYILKKDLIAAKNTLEKVMPRDRQFQNVAERDIALVRGELALAQGDPDAALKIAGQLLASAPGKSPDRTAQPIPHLLKLKGEALIALSRLDEAVDALEEAKRGARERDERSFLWSIHRSSGQVYQVLHRSDQARQEYAEARLLIDELAATVEDASLRSSFERSALDAIPKEKPPHPVEAAKGAFGDLTVREREVAALVAEGKTSREIAQLLVISERTVEVHVGNILRKLGFSSRSQIAVWAAEKGLLKR